MRDSVPSGSYSSVCNVLRQWHIPLIPTYRVYRLYDKLIHVQIHTITDLLNKQGTCTYSRLFINTNICDRICENMQNYGFNNYVPAAVFVRIHHFISIACSFFGSYEL